MTGRPAWHTVGKSRSGSRKPVPVETRQRRKPRASFGLDAAARHETETVRLTLPMPPSTNALFANGGDGGRVKTKAYRDWIEEAGWILLAQKPGRISGRYEMEISVARPDTKRRIDLGNREKAISDLLTTHHVIVDDSDAERITLAWSDDLEGVHVVLRKAI